MAKKVRVRLYESEALFLGLNVKVNTKGRHQARYTISKDDYDVIEGQRSRLTTTSHTQPNNYSDDMSVMSSWVGNQNMDIKEYCKFYNLPHEDITSYKLVSHTGTPYYNIVFKEKVIGESGSALDVEALIKKQAKHVVKLDIEELYLRQPCMDFDQLTYTDVHIGMDTNKYNNAMYPVRWIKEDILKAAKDMVWNTLQHKKSNTLVVDDLGDLLDGLLGKTTRGGHDLPQLMTDEEAYDCAVLFKDTITDGIAPFYERIILNNITNDNHAGIFGSLLNKSVKRFQELRYDHVEVNNHNQFINHYFVGDICFIITHGKEDKNVKFGFNVYPKDKDIKKIDRYCKENRLYEKAKLVIFKKGDSHQCLFDMCSSADFYYHNYPALSPSSNWVQDNFELGRRGYVLESFSGTQNYTSPVFIGRD